MDDQEFIEMLNQKLSHEAKSASARVIDGEFETLESYREQVGYIRGLHFLKTAWNEARDELKSKELMDDIY